MHGGGQIVPGLLGLWLLVTGLIMFAFHASLQKCCGWGSQNNFKQDVVYSWARCCCMFWAAIGAEVAFCALIGILLCLCNNQGHVHIRDGPG
jgi:hypothetical protein